MNQGLPKNKKKSSKTFSLISLGCLRNTYDSEVIAQDYLDKGFSLVENSGKADVLIINTCGFIKPAKEESLQYIATACDLREKGKIKQLVVRGCLVARYHKELEKIFPQVDVWDTIIDYYYPFRKISLLPEHIAVVKVGEGCNNNCSYCIIPKIKGKLRSRPGEDIFREVEYYNRKKVKELIIIGQDITSWKGKSKKEDIAWLVRTIARKAKNIPWIRLLYTHPLHLSKKLLRVIKEEKNICPYIDLPLQHISWPVLKAMNRKISPKQIYSLVKTIREIIPESVIRTSFIVGFPGEREEDFNKLKKFVSKVKFNHLGVFLYSREEGTSAYNLPGQVHYQTKKRRQKEIMLLQKEISNEYNKQYIGRDVEVLVDENEPGFSVGRLQSQAYEIDGVVYIPDKKIKPGSFVRVKIVDSYEYDLVGRC